MEHENLGHPVDAFIRNPLVWLVLLVGLLVGGVTFVAERESVASRARERMGRQRQRIEAHLQGQLEQIDAQLLVLESLVLEQAIRAGNPWLLPRSWDWPRRFPAVARVELLTMTGGSERPVPLQTLYQKPDGSSSLPRPERLFIGPAGSALLQVGEAGRQPHLLMAHWLQDRQNAFWLAVWLSPEPLLPPQQAGLDPGIAFELYLGESVVPFLQGFQPADALTFRSAWQAPQSHDLSLLGMPGRLYLAPLPSFDSVPGYRYPRLIAQRTLLVILAGLMVIWISSVARFRSEARMRQHASSLDKLLTRFKAHLASTPLAVLDLDENGLILAFNRAAEELFGYQAGEVLGRSFTLLFPQEESDGISTLYLNPYRLLTGQQFMAPNITKGGTIVYGQWFNTPIFDGNGHFDGVIAMVENVSEKRRKEITRHKKMKWESLGVMAGGICHDFNNLLTSILGYIEMARASTGGEPLQWLAKSENAARRAAQLVDLLLAFSGKSLGHFESLEIGELMREAMGEFRLVLGSKVAFSLNTKTAHLVGDRSQLVEAVRILLRNSLEAVPDQGGRIQVECSPCHLTPEDLARGFSGQGLSEGDYLQLTVSDNGCGMEESRLDLIFDPFYSTKFQGRGLGLSVLFGVLKSHRAGFRIKSAPGQGTRFSLFFPLAEQSGDGADGAVPGSSSSDQAGPLKDERD